MNISAALAPIIMDSDIKAAIDGAIAWGSKPVWDFTGSADCKAVAERFVVVVVEGERDFCSHDPNPYVVSLTCALAPFYDWAKELHDEWAPLARTSHQLGVEKYATPDLIARVISDALDEEILTLDFAELDDVLTLSRFALECSPKFGHLLLRHVESWLNTTEDGPCVT